MPKLGQVQRTCQEAQEAIPQPLKEDQQQLTALQGVGGKGGAALDA